MGESGAIIDCVLGAPICSLFATRERYVEVLRYGAPLVAERLAVIDSLPWRELAGCMCLDQVELFVNEAEQRIVPNEGKFFAELVFVGISCDLAKIISNLSKNWTNIEQVYEICAKWRSFLDSTFAQTSHIETSLLLNRKTYPFDVLQNRVKDAFGRLYELEKYSDALLAVDVCIVSVEVFSWPKKWCTTNQWDDWCEKFETYLCTIDEAVCCVITTQFKDVGLAKYAPVWYRVSKYFQKERSFAVSGLERCVVAFEDVEGPIYTRLVNAVAHNSLVDEWHKMALLLWAPELVPKIQAHKVNTCKLYSMWLDEVSQRIAHVSANNTLDVWLQIVDQVCVLKKIVRIPFRIVQFCERKFDFNT